MKVFSKGEITQTGVGFVVKKRLLNLMELFRPRKKQKGGEPMKKVFRNVFTAAFLLLILIGCSSIDKAYCR